MIWVGCTRHCVHDLVSRLYVWELFNTTHQLLWVAITKVNKENWTVDLKCMKKYLVVRNKWKQKRRRRRMHRNTYDLKNIIRAQKNGDEITLIFDFYYTLVIIYTFKQTIIVTFLPWSGISSVAMNKVFSHSFRPEYRLCIKQINISSQDFFSKTFS